MKNDLDATVVAIFMMLMGGFVLFIMLKADGGRESRALVARQPATRRWHVVGERLDLNQVFTVAPTGWQETCVKPGDVPRWRVSYFGEVAADQPVKILLISKQDADRLKEGYPPVPIASFSTQPTGLAKIAFASPQDPWCLGVFPGDYLESKPPDFPKTLSGAGLAILQGYAKAAAPPAKVTLKLTQRFEYFSSDSTAQRVKQEIAKHMAKVVP